MYRLYHNNRCSKSREALALLEQKQLQFQVRYYLDDPLTASELVALLKALAMPARQLLRSKEAEYKALGLDNPDLSEQQLIEVMVSTPKLIERPILQCDDKAVIGRPVENLLVLLP
ncbi:arsenate reductase (glutaredoxin) [Rheinheimera sp.]|uniref:arsenate reductase (glutaredoxin) n=1 Tax=Rheinheimera sp. TaxID=1869214 RepID=UPI00307F6339